MNGQCINTEFEEHPIISPKKLLETVLPTIKDVLENIEYLRLRALSSTNFDPSIKSLLKESLLVLISIWQKTDIPIISNRGIEKIINKQYESFKALKKRIKSHPNA